MYEGLGEELGEGFPKPADPDPMEQSKFMQTKKVSTSIPSAFLE
jgi:hypothetical protein